MRVLQKSGMQYAYLLAIIIEHIFIDLLCRSNLKISSWRWQEVSPASFWLIEFPFLLISIISIFPVNGWMLLTNSLPTIWHQRVYVPSPWKFIKNVSHSRPRALQNFTMSQKGIKCLKEKVNGHYYITEIKSLPKNYEMLCHLKSQLTRTYS